MCNLFILSQSSWKKIPTRFEFQFRTDLCRIIAFSDQGWNSSLTPLPFRSPLNNDSINLHSVLGQMHSQFTKLFIRTHYYYVFCWCLDGKDKEEMNSSQPLPPAEWIIKSRSCHIVNGQTDGSVTIDLCEIYSCEINCRTLWLTCKMYWRERVQGCFADLTSLKRNNLSLLHLSELTRRKGLIHSGGCCPIITTCLDNKSNI